MISVIIPAFDEGGAIAETVNSVKKVLSNDSRFKGFEIIVVDDGSSDGTGDIAKDNGAVVIRHPQNIGYGRALKSGIAAAKNEWIAITDADGTYPIDQIPVLYDEIEKGFDMAVGTRTGEEYRESAFKSPLRKILKFLVEFTAGRKIPDINSGLRIFRKSDAQNFQSQLCDTFSYTTSITLAFMMNTMFISYIDISYYKRVGQTKVRLFRDALVTLQYITQAILYYNPIKLFMLMSVMTVLFGVVTYLISQSLSFVGGYYILIGCILLSILIFALGLLADLLRQIMSK